MAVLTERAKMADLTAKVKARALEAGADAVGVAPIERFQGAPLGYKPTDLLPGAKSVVAFVVHQLAGYCDTGPIASYFHFGYAFKNLYLARISWEIARVLDDHGFWALPYCREGQTTAEIEWRNPNPYLERFKKKGKPGPRKAFVSMRGDICLRHAAEAAGLGQIPISGVFMTPKYGPRVRIGVCLTTAELEPDPLITEELCDNCLNCVKACPANAITEKGPEEFDSVACLIAITGVDSSWEDMLQFTSQVFGEWDWIQKLRYDARNVTYSFFRPIGICGSACLNACPVGRRKMK